MAKMNISFKIDKEILDKLHVVSDYYGRSMSGHVLWLIRESIVEYEQKNGKIAIGDKK